MNCTSSLIFYQTSYRIEDNVGHVFIYVTYVNYLLDALKFKTLLLTYWTSEHWASNNSLLKSIILPRTRRTTCLSHHMCNTEYFNYSFIHSFKRAQHFSTRYSVIGALLTRSNYLTLNNFRYLFLVPNFNNNCTRKVVPINIAFKLVRPLSLDLSFYSFLPGNGKDVGKLLSICLVTVFILALHQSKDVVTINTLRIFFMLLVTYFMELVASPLFTFSPRWKVKMDEIGYPPSD